MRTILSTLNQFDEPEPPAITKGRKSGRRFGRSCCVSVVFLLLVVLLLGSTGCRIQNLGLPFNPYRPTTVPGAQTKRPVVLPGSAHSQSTSDTELVPNRVQGLEPQG